MGCSPQGTQVILMLSYSTGRQTETGKSCTCINYTHFVLAVHIRCTCSMHTRGSYRILSLGGGGGDIPGLSPHPV